jgi:hypothetical protein
MSAHKRIFEDVREYEEYLISLAKRNQVKPKNKNDDSSRNKPKN